MTPRALTRSLLTAALSLALVATALAVALVAPAATPAHAAGDSPADGEWVGFLRYDGSADFATDAEDVHADYQGAGGFGATVTGGTADGDYEMQINAELPDLGTSGRGDAGGTITGPVTQMKMTLAGLVVSEPTLGMNFTFSAADLGNPVGELIVTESACAMMEGTWNHEFSMGVAAAGGSTSGPGGTWTALRMGEGSAEEMRERMRDLQSRADAVLTDFANATLDINGLRGFLDSAEEAASGSTRSECSPGATELRHLARFAIDELLNAGGLLLDELTLRELWALIQSGTRTGAFDADPDLRAAYESHLLFLASEAAAAGDEGMLHNLYAYASLAGWHDTADAITEYLEEL